MTIIASGLTYFGIDGQLFDVMDEVTMDVQTIERKLIPNFANKNFFGLPPKQGTVTAKLVDTGLSKQQFMDMDGVTISVQQPNGYSVVFADAWCESVSEISVTAESSSFSVTFRSGLIQETTQSL